MKPLVFVVFCMAVLALPGRSAASDPAVLKLIDKLKAGDDKAAAALVALGPKAVPDLVDYMQKHVKDAGVAWAVADVLGRIGAPAVTPLRDAMKKGDPTLPLAALKRMGPAAQDALPEVLGVLKGDPDANPNSAPAYLLALDIVGQLGPAAKDAVPLLLPALKAGHAAAAPACLALGRIGPAAQDAVPALTALAEKGPQAVRPFAKDALTRIKGK